MREGAALLVVAGEYNGAGVAGAGSRECGKAALRVDKRVGDHSEARYKDRIGTKPVTRRILRVLLDDGSKGGQVAV